MSAMSDHVETQTGNHWLRGQALAADTTDLSLFLYQNGANVGEDNTGGTEIAATQLGGAATIAVGGSPNFTASGGTFSNSAAISFPTALTGAQVTVGHFAIKRGSTLLFRGDLAAPRVLDPGDAVSFPIGTLQIVFA